MGGILILAIWILVALFLTGDNEHYPDDFIAGG